MFLSILFRNPAFWAALSALINALIVWLIPDFPNDILILLNALLAIIFAAISTTAAVQTVRQINAAKAQGK